MIHTPQFLQQEIIEAKPFALKQKHQSLKKQQFMQYYNELAQLYCNEQQERINEEMRSQEQKDDLLRQKMRLRRSLVECNKSYSLAQMQKKELLGKCQHIEWKVQKQKQRNQQLRQKQESIARQSGNLKRKIKEIETLCSKMQLQKAELRRRCQDQLENVQQFKLRSKTQHLQFQISSTIDSNIDLTHNLHQNNRQSYQYNQLQSQNTKQKLLDQYKSLQHLLKRQNEQNQTLKKRLEVEQFLQLFYTTKIKIVQKCRQIRESILKKKLQSQQSIQQNLQDLLVENHFMRQKLESLTQLQLQLRQAHKGLIETMRKFKEAERHSIQKIALKSTRAQKAIDSRYLLQQRRNLIDKYKNYLLSERK